MSKSVSKTEGLTEGEMTREHAPQRKAVKEEGHLVTHEQFYLSLQNGKQKRNSESLLGYIVLF